MYKTVNNDDIRFWWIRQKAEDYAKKNNCEVSQATYYDYWKHVLSSFSLKIY